MVPEIKKILFATDLSKNSRHAAYELNQRPPAEVAPSPSRGHPHTPGSAGGR